MWGKAVLCGKYFLFAMKIYLDLGIYVPSDLSNDTPNII